MSLPESPLFLPPYGFHHPDLMGHDVMTQNSSIHTGIGSFIDRICALPDRLSPCLIVTAPRLDESGETIGHDAAAITVVMEHGKRIELGFDIDKETHIGGATFGSILHGLEHGQRNIVVSLATPKMTEIYNDCIGAQSGNDEAAKGDKLSASGLATEPFEDYPNILKLSDAQYSRIYQVTGVSYNERARPAWLQRLRELLPRSEKGEMRERLRKASRAVVHAVLVAEWTNPGEAPPLNYCGKVTVCTEDGSGVKVRRYMGSDEEPIDLPIEPLQLNDGAPFLADQEYTIAR